MQASSISAAYAEEAQIQENAIYSLSEDEIIELLSKVSGNEKWQNLLKNEIVKTCISFVVSLLGTVVALLLITKEIKGVIMKMTNSIKRCEDGDQTLAETVRDLQEAKKEMIVLADATKAQLDITNEKIKMLEATIEKMEEERVAQTDRMMKIMQIAFCNDPSLVANGLAGTIYKISEGEDIHEEE